MVPATGAATVRKGTFSAGATPATSGQTTRFRLTDVKARTRSAAIGTRIRNARNAEARKGLPLEIGGHGQRSFLRSAPSYARH